MNRKSLLFSISIINLISMLVFSWTHNLLIGLVCVIISFLLILSPVHLIPILVYSSFLGDYFKITQGLSISRIVSILFLFGGLRLIIKNKGINRKYLVLLYLTTLITFISSIFSITGNIVSFNTFFLNVLILIIYCNLKNIDLKEINIMLVTSSIILAFYFIIILLKDPTQFESTRLTIGENVNVNSFAKAISQNTCIFLGCLLITPKISFKILGLLLSLIQIYLILLTGSRTSLIALISSFFICYFIIIHLERRVSKKIRSILAGIITFLIGLILIFPYLNIEILNRFSIENISSDGGSGRKEIWMILIKEIIPNNLFSGIGIGSSNMSVVMSPYLPTISHAHNLFLEILSHVGIIGLFLFIILFLKIFKDTYQAIKQDRVSIIGMIVFLNIIIIGIGESVLLDRILWNAIGICVVFILHTKKKQELRYET